MTRRIPILATLVVFATVATMIALGIWQLHRARWKEGLLAQYSRSASLPPITWPTAPISDAQLPLFRHATGNCLRVTRKRAIAGENLSGEPGYAQIVDCVTGAEGPGMSVELGWSNNPNARINWNGGLVSGTIGPDRLTRMRLVAATAPQGLERSAPPSITSIPNNHRSYAVQWFSFATLALIIYVLAVRKRWKEEQTPG